MMFTKGWLFFILLTINSLCTGNHPAARDPSLPKPSSGQQDETSFFQGWYIVSAFDIQTQRLGFH